MSTRTLFLVMAGVELAHEREYDRWYDEEQLPRLSKLPGILAARRYRAVYGEPKYLELYELGTPAAIEHIDSPSGSGDDPEAPRPAHDVRRSLLDVSSAAYSFLSSQPVPEPTDLSRAQALMLRGLEIAPEYDAEFQDWYNSEDLPNLARVAGVIRAHRYRLDRHAAPVVGDPPTYVACYDLERSEVQASEEWQRRNDTPWTHRMRRYYVSRLRNVYQRISST